MDLSAQESTYHAESMRGPEIQDLRQMNKELNLMCTEEELQEMAALQKESTRQVEKLLRMVDPNVPQVKYPRTPGYRPAPEDNPYNAWAWRCDIQGASSGKLAGRTVAIKDNTAVAGVPMRCGSTIMDGYMPEFDATVVSRILDAGGRITGKAGMEPLSASGGSVCCSDGIIPNPFDQRRDAGGSSSGSAVLVASGHVDMAIGGDQGGSVRMPASFTGIVGMKPTWGLVPYTGAAHAEYTVDHLGPMTRTVQDCALLLEVIAGYDAGRDPRQFPTLTIPEYSTLVNQDVRGKKIGLLKEGFELCSEEVVRTVVMGAAQALTEVGCIVKETSVPMHKYGKQLSSITIGREFYKCTIENTGYLERGYHFSSFQEALQRGIKASPQDLPPLAKYIAISQRYVDQVYGARLHTKGRNLIYNLDLKYEEVLKEGAEGVDVLVMPTVPHVAPLIPPADVSLSALAKHVWSNNLNTMPFNLTGHPAITVNAGFSPPDPVTGKGRLPIGLMIVGRKFDDVTVLQVARAVEQLVNK